MKTRPLLTRLTLVATLGLTSLAPTLLASADAHSDKTPAMPAAADVLATLLAGNRRFVGGTATHPDQDAGRRLAQSKGQTPTAIVLTCADSRVSPELCFDQGIGTLFVIRNAGNVVDDHVIGSIEYAVSHLKIPLIIVMGHEKCGAVSAAVGGGHAPGHIHSIVESIEPAVEAAKDQPGDQIDNTVRANARHVAAILSRSEPVLGPAVSSGTLKVLAGRYDIETGEFEILP